MKTTHKKLVGGLLFGVLIACIGTPFAVGQTNDISENTSPTILFGTAEIQGTNGLASFGPGLTDEQQTEIDTLVKTLSDKNASPEEIEKAIQEKLIEFGVWDANAGVAVSTASLCENMSIPPQKMFGSGVIQGTSGFVSVGFGLTDEQQTEIDTLVKTLSDKNTSPEEINKAIQEKLTEFGVQDPNAQTITVSSATVIPAGQ